MVLRALRRSLGLQLALDGAQRFFEAVDASAVPSLERGGQLALKPLAALRQFASAHVGFLSTIALACKSQFTSARLSLGNWRLAGSSVG